MDKIRRWLYLPIDVKVREIEAKIFLAFRAAGRGYNVVLGQKQKFPSVMSCYSAGYYLGFGAMESFKSEYRNFIKRGHGIILVDEEGLVTHREAIYIRNRLVPDLLAQAKAFLAWGDKQAELVRRTRPEYASQVLSSGNPRFDVLRLEQRYLYTEQVQKLQKEHGDFILISSSFGSCNHYTGRDRYLQSLREKKVIQNDEDFDYYSRYFQYRFEMMQEFLKALPLLRIAFPGNRIIVRPHPSENIETWKVHTNKLENVHVLHEGSAIPWLLAAGAVVHNFCTTSLEAFALGRSPIAYRPIFDENLETPLPSLASIEAFSAEELVEKIRDSLEGKADPRRSEKEKIVGEYIANLSGPYACDVLLDHLEGAALPSSPFNALAPILHSLRKVAEKTKAMLKGEGKNSYVAHKFPGLDIKEVRDLARRMENIPGQYSNLPMRMIHENCVLIEGMRK